MKASFHLPSVSRVSLSGNVANDYWLWGLPKMIKNSAGTPQLQGTWADSLQSSQQGVVRSKFAIIKKAACLCIYWALGVNDA